MIVIHKTKISGLIKSSNPYSITDIIDSLLSYNSGYTYTDALKILHVDSIVSDRREADSIIIDKMDKFLPEPPDGFITKLYINYYVISGSFGEHRVDTDTVISFEKMCEKV